MKLFPSFFATALCALSVNLASAATATVQVGPNDTLTFSPANVTINVGDTVHWVVETNTHTTTSNTSQLESWDSGDISSGETFDHTFTHAGTFAYHCSIHVSFGMDGNVTVTGVTPSGLSTLSLANSTVIAGQNTTANLTLTDPAPAGGANVTVTSSDPRVTVLTSPVVIAAGDTIGQTTLNTASSITPYSANITASYNGTTKTATLKVNPPTGLTKIQILPDTVVGGTSVNATVTFGSAIANQTVVDLKSSDPSATVPSTLTLKAHAITGSFTIKTKAVTSETMPLISASSGGLTVKTMLMVEPVEVQSVSVTPSTVIGGNISNGTVTLLLPPPAAVAVTLSSSSTAAKLSAKSVSIAKGKTSGTFKITTTKVTQITDAQIGASVKDSSANTTLTIDPPK